MGSGPKICIVFNAGAIGDFLVSLIHQQYTGCSHDLQIPHGAVIGAPGHSFKMACLRFYENNFSLDEFDRVGDAPVVNTHHCYPEILNLFPDCKFYYIDDTKYVHITVDRYISKRLMVQNISLTEWVNCSRLKKIKTNRTLNLSDDKIKQIMYQDWIRNCRAWANMGLEKIEFSDILDFKKCSKLVETVIQSSINADTFSNTYTTWARKNADVLNAVNKDNV